MLTIITSPVSGKDAEPAHIVDEYPPIKEYTVRLLGELGRPWVIRHRLITIDIKVLVDVLERAQRLEEMSQSDPIVFPLFDDIELTVQLTNVIWFAPGGWLAEYTIINPAPIDGAQRINRGNLTINEKSGGIDAVFYYRKRQFALHFTGQRPFYVAVENDPSLLPAID